MAFLDLITNWVQTAMGASTVLVIAVELLLRLVPTASKISLVAPGLRKLGQLVVSVADLIDKVLPQNIKPSA